MSRSKAAKRTTKNKPNLTRREQRGLSVSYNNLGDIAKARNDYKAAEGYYAKALEISKRLAKMFPGVPMLKDDLAVSLFRCGTCSADGKLSPEKKRCCVTMSPWGEGRFGKAVSTG